MERVKILHLEDSEDDAGLVRRALSKSDFPFELQLVDNQQDFCERLKSFCPDVILSDHSLPSFNSFQALAIVKRNSIDVPFILVTATVTEEFAVTILKQGAEDYILKDRMQRLPAAIKSALEKRTAERLSQQHHQELIRNEKKFRALIENTNDLIGMFDDQFRMIYRSPNYQRITGWSREELVSIGGLTVVHPDDLLPCQLVMKDVMENPGRTFHAAYRFKHKNGHYIWLAGTVTNLLHDESIRGIVSNMRDVSESRASELAIKHFHQRLLFHLENSPLGFIEWDSDLNIKSCSKRAEEIFGWSEHELTTHQINGYSAVYEEDMESAAQIANQLLSGQVVRNNVRHRNKKRDGTLIWCEWYNSVLKNANGEVITIMSLVQDVTERQVSEIEKNDLLVQLREQNTDLKQFSFIASHNLRGPVASLLGLVNIFDSTQSEEESAQIIRHIKTAAHNLDGIIHDLAKVVEVRIKDLTNKESFDIHDILEQVKGELQQELAACVVHFETRITQELIYTCREYFHSILYHLISNAVKFRSNKRELRICIDASRSSGIVSLAVSDNGMGLDLDQFGEKVFSLYQRFHPHLPGRGLGLYLIRTYVHRMNGSVHMESKPDQGTTVHVELKE